jgi:flagellar biosynthetic protein FliR
MSADLAALLSQVQAPAAAGFVVFLRVGAAMALLPAFGELLVPARVRLVLALAFTLIVAPSVPPVTPTPAVMLTEPLIGLVFGIGLRMLVMALQTAGTIMAQSSSLSPLFAGTGVEPQPVIGQLLLFAGLAAATAAGLHVRLAEALVRTYALFPPGRILPAADLLDWGLERIAASFLLAMQLSMPFAIAGLVYNVALGFINRAMPQLMVAFVGAPALTAGGLVLLALCAPSLLEVWSAALDVALAGPF